VSAYFELDSPQTMHADAEAVEARLHLVAPRLPFTDLYSDYPTDQPKPVIEITEAAQRLAAALELHLG
jgi:hypothetical protein